MRRYLLPLLVLGLSACAAGSSGPAPRGQSPSIKPLKRFGKSVTLHFLKDSTTASFDNFSDRISKADSLLGISGTHVATFDIDTALRSTVKQAFAAVVDTISLGGAPTGGLRFTVQTLLLEGDGQSGNPFKKGGRQNVRLHLRFIPDEGRSFDSYVYGSGATRTEAVEETLERLANDIVENLMRWKQPTVSR